jgi:N-acetylneuraminic acid mutarotase
MLRAMGMRWLWVGCASLAFAAACGDDGAVPVDAGRTGADGGARDAGLGDAAGIDGSRADDAGVTMPGWREDAPLPVDLQEISAAVVDREIYVAGGFEGLTVVSTVRIYDPAADVWREGPSLPLPRHHLMLVALDGDLYSLGGMAPGGFSATAECYVLRSDAAMWEEIAPLPEPRGAGAAGAIGGKIYVAAGQGRGATLLAATLEYDPVGDAWRERASIGEPREHLAGFVYGGELWTVGGRAVIVGSNSTTVEIYDPVADSWRTGPSLATPHGGFAAAVYGDVAVAVGGERADRALDDVEVIRLPDGEWELAAPVPTPRHGHAMAAVDGRFYVIGGADEPVFAAVDSVESFAP